MARATGTRQVVKQESVVLYHYTSVDVLERITDEKELWASSVHYLNDGREFAHALEIFDHALERAVAVDRPCRKYLLNVRKQLEQNAWRDVFVTSFSEHGDLLSQWRAYCPPGRGVSIGLRKELLESAASRYGFRLVRCKYDRLTQKTRAREMVRELVKELDDICAALEAADIEQEEDSDRTYTADDLVRMFVVEFASVGPQMKDPAFGEEREWRLVGLPTDFNKLTVQYRSGASYLVPYLRFPLPVSEDGRLLFSDLILGPTPHRDLSRRAIVNLFAARNVDYETVRSTAVPYRSW